MAEVIGVPAARAGRRVPAAVTSAPARGAVRAGADAAARAAVDGFMKVMGWFPKESAVKGSNRRALSSRPGRFIRPGTSLFL
jgi:hypothetical protein